MKNKISIFMTIICIATFGSVQSKAAAEAGGGEGGAGRDIKQYFAETLRSVDSAKFPLVRSLFNSLDRMLRGSGPMLKGVNLYSISDDEQEAFKKLTGYNPGEDNEEDVATMEAVSRLGDILDNPGFMEEIRVLGRELPADKVDEYLKEANADPDDPDSALQHYANAATQRDNPEWRARIVLNLVFGDNFEDYVSKFFSMLYKIGYRSTQEGPAEETLQLSRIQKLKIKVEDEFSIYNTLSTDF